MKTKKNPDGAFDVVLGIDMETDVGSFTADYAGVREGAPRLLDLMDRRGIRATWFWTGHAAENNPGVLKAIRRAGHEIGCHGLYHETLGDALFPLPNNWPVLPSEVEGRLVLATGIVEKIAGVRPRSFRAPRGWASTRVLNILEKLGYRADASLMLYYQPARFAPYHPSTRDWTKPGRLTILEIPNFCDPTMKSRDPYQRDRDQWPIFRTRSAEALVRRVDAFVRFVRARGRRPVACFYFHPWEFHPMPRVIDYGEASVRPLPFIVKNCGPRALVEFDRMCALLADRGARFSTALDIAAEHQ